MEDDKNIDELFSKVIQKDHPYDEKLWKSLEPNLPTSSESFFYRFRKPFGLLALITFVGVGIYFMSSEKDSRVSTNKKAILRDVDVRLNKELIAKNTTNDYSKLIEKPNELNQKELAIDKTNEKVLKNNVEVEKENYYNSTKPLSSAEVFSNKGISKTINSSTNSKSSSDRDKQINSQTAISNTFSNIHNEDRRNTIGNDIELNTKEFSNSKTIDFMQSRGFSADLDNANLAALNRLSNEESNDVPKSIFDKIEDRIKRHFKAIEFEALYSIDINKKVNNASETFINYKRNSEQTISNKQFGINFLNQYKLLTYGVGIEYAEYTERINYNFDKETVGYDISYDTTYQLINSNYVSNGVPVLLIKEMISENRSPKIIVVDDILSTKNTFKRIQVPVFVGIQKSFNNFSAELRTALVFNYMLDVNGVSINKNLDQISDLNISQMNKLFYGNSNSLSLSYALNEYLGLGLRYKYDLDITSYTKNYDSKLNLHQGGIFLIYHPK